MSDHDEITRLWSDEELDEALRSLHAEPDDSQRPGRREGQGVGRRERRPDLRRRRGRLGNTADQCSSAADAAAAPGHRRRRWVRVALAAGIAAVLVTIGLLIPSFITAAQQAREHRGGHWGVEPGGGGRPRRHR